MHEALPHARAGCGAKTRSGGACKNAPMENGRCRMHGGATPAGIASPHFRTGRYSRYLPDRLLARYHTGQADPDLLSQHEEIALIDARLADLLQRVDTGESGMQWKKARKAFADLQKALNNETEPDGMDQFQALAALAEAIAEGIADYEAWNEVNRTLNRRRQLVESERKRFVEMQQTITVERAMTLIAAMADIVKRHVSDQTTRTLIGRELLQLTGREPGRVLDGAGGGDDHEMGAAARSADSGI